MVMGRAVSWQDIKGDFQNKRGQKKRGRRRTKSGREKKEVKQKKQGQYTQRNVLQTVELAKLKCTVTMGTLEEKEEKKRLTMKYRKKAETIFTFKLHPNFNLNSITVNQFSKKHLKSSNH